MSFHISSRYSMLYGVIYTKIYHFFSVFPTYQNVSFFSKILVLNEASQTFDEFLYILMLRCSNTQTETCVLGIKMVSKHFLGVLRRKQHRYKQLKLVEYTFVIHFSEKNICPWTNFHTSKPLTIFEAIVTNHHARFLFPTR